MRGDINPKQQRFADEYLTDLNATQAAIRAGYSKKTADKIGSDLLRKTGVAAYLKQKSQTIADKLGVTAEFVLGSLKSVHDKTVPTRHQSNPAVALKALDFMGKHLKLWDNDDKKQQTNVTIQILKF